MAAVARRACQAYDRVEIEQTDFEHFDGRRRTVRPGVLGAGVALDSAGAPHAEGALGAPTGRRAGAVLEQPGWDAIAAPRGAARGLRAGRRRLRDAVGGAGPMYPTVRPTVSGPWATRRSSCGVDRVRRRPERRLVPMGSTRYTAAEYVELSADALRPYARPGCRAAKRCSTRSRPRSTGSEARLTVAYVTRVLAAGRPGGDP